MGGLSNIPGMRGAQSRGDRYKPRDVRSLKLRAKLLLVVAGVLVPLVALGIYGLTEAYARRWETVQTSMEQRAKTAAVTVDRAFTDALQLGAVLAETLPVGQATVSELEAQLFLFAELRPEVLNLLIVDAEGKAFALARKGPGEEPTDVSDRAYFQQAMRLNEPRLSNVLIGRALKVPTVAVAAPMARAGEASSGAVIVGLRLEAIAERLRALRADEEQAIWLVDPAGRLAFHTSRDTPGWDERDVSSISEVRRALDGEVVWSDAFRGPVDGERRFAVLHPVGEHGWVVGASWVRSDAFEALRTAGRRQSFIFVVLALLSLGGALLAASVFSRRLQAIGVQTRRLASGDLSARVRHREPGDELDALGREFNVMADFLEEERQRRALFASAVGHELKNLLMPLALSSKLLERDDVPAEKVVQTSQRLGAQVRRIDRLVGDLVDFSRLEAGTFTLQRGPVDVVEVLRHVVEVHQEERIVVSAPERLVVDADGDRLAQVITNLVSNALKYSPEGGTIQIAVGVAEGQMRLEVRDPGLGLDPAEIAELFEPYRRLHASTRIRGVGLGLFVSRRIMDAHQGGIGAESPGRGQGATFWITLPLGG